MLDESDAITDAQIDDFNGRLNEGKIPLSAPMLEWLADNENAPEVIKHFLEKPRESRRIFRLGTPQAQKTALTKLANASAPRDTGTEPKAPNFKPVRGRGAASVPDLSEVENYAEYEAIRRKQQRGTRSGFSVN